MGSRCSTFPFLIKSKGGVSNSAIFVSPFWSISIMVKVAYEMFRLLSTGRVSIIVRAVRIIGSLLIEKFIAIEAVIVLKTFAFIPLPNPSDKTAIQRSWFAILCNKTVSPQAKLPFLFIWKQPASTNIFSAIVLMLYSYSISSEECLSAWSWLWDSMIELSILSV